MNEIEAAGNARLAEDAAKEAVIEPVKKKRGGRVKGSKNKPKDKPIDPVTEPDTAKTLRQFIKEITESEEFRNSLKKRISEGKLSASESRMVEKILDAPAEKKQEGWQKMLAVATEAELVLLADLMRRANVYVGKPATPKRKRTVRPESPSTLGQQSETAISAGELAGTRDGLGTQALTKQVLSTPSSGVEQGPNDLPGRSQ